MSRTHDWARWLREPFTPPILKLRRNLLIVATIGLVMSWTGLVPKEITMLGVKFEQTEQTSLLLIAGVIVLYHLVTFVIYFISEAQATAIERWRGAFEELDGTPLGQSTRWITILRASVDVIVPILIGLTASWVLLIQNLSG